AFLEEVGAGQCGDGDQVTPVQFQLFDSGAGRVERTGQVRVDDAVPCFQAHLVDGGEAADAGVGNGDVQLAELFYCPPDHRRLFGKVTDVAAQSECLAGPTAGQLL